jgi:pyruvate dehydrogenase E2 component (dihydrolipoamide acetyltransferase)
MIEIFMPKVGMDMEEGKLIRWLKEIGDPVEKDEPIMEIETDKIAMEVESPGTGYLLAKFIEAESTVPVLQVIGYIGEKGEAVPEAPVVKAAEINTKAALEEYVPQKSQDSSLALEDMRPAATPYARKLAKEKGIDLSRVTPSGLHGEVVSGDILSVTPLARRIAEDEGIALGGFTGSGHKGKIRKEDILSRIDSTDDIKRIPLSNSRKVVAKRMLRSHTEIPVVTQHMKVYVDNLVEFRRQINIDRDEKVSINDFMIKIVAMALREHPVFRSRLEDDHLVVLPDVNIGFAVGTDEELIVPVVHNADRLPLSVISKITKELINKARSGKLKIEEMTGGCFTISNMGMFDMYAFTPIINQPDSGILGVNAIHDELYLVGGSPMMRNYMMISLTYDHRITSGVGAAKFQIRIKELMEHPLQALVII